MHKFFEPPQDATKSRVNETRVSDADQLHQQYPHHIAHETRSDDTVTTPSTSIWDVGVPDDGDRQAADAASWRPFNSLPAPVTIARPLANVPEAAVDPVFDDEIGGTRRPAAIVGWSAVSMRFRFFSALVGQGVIDLVFLMIVLGMMGSAHWLLDLVKEALPMQVAIVEWAERFGLAGLGICAAWYIVADVVETVRRTTDVMLKED